jgi:hypothetical protein
MLSEIAEQNAMFKERVGFFQSGGAGGFQKIPSGLLASYYPCPES